MDCEITVRQSRLTGRWKWVVEEWDRAAADWEIVAEGDADSMAGARALAAGWVAATSAERRAADIARVRG